MAGDGAAGIARDHGCFSFVDVFFCPLRQALAGLSSVSGGSGDGYLGGWLRSVNEHNEKYSAFNVHYFYPAPQTRSSIPDEARMAPGERVEDEIHDLVKLRRESVVITLEKDRRTGEAEEHILEEPRGARAGRER